MVSATLFAKALGLLRSMILAWTLGSSAEAAAFAAASKTPCALFDLFFSSAVTACFIPAYNKAGARECGAFSAAFFGAVLLFSAVFSALGVAFSPQIIALTAPKLPPATAALSARLLRIMFPMAVLAAGVYTLTGILQSAGAFLLPASVSALSNAFMAGYLILAGKSFSVYALSAAYVFSWFLQFITLALPLCARGLMPRPKIDFRDKNLRACLAGVPKIMAGSLLSPALLFTAQFFASFVSEGAFVLYDYASGIYTIVAGIAVYGVGNFVFPRLSALFGRGERAAAQSGLARALLSAMLVVLPVSAAVFVLAEDGIALLYGRGNFGAELAAPCARALRALSPAMPAYAAAEILSRAFYADGKACVPIYAAIPAMAVCIIANALSLLFGGGLVGICVSFTAAVWAQAAALVLSAVKHFPALLREKRLHRAPLLALAFALCAGAMAFSQKNLQIFASFPATIATFLKIAIVFTVGIVIYLICIYIMGFCYPEKEKR